jgi:hypothetical protein
MKPKEARNFRCPETGDLCKSPDCSVSAGKVICRGDHRPHAEPSRTPKAAIQHATKEREAKRRQEAKRIEFEQSKEGKKLAADISRQLEEAEFVYLKENGFTNPKAIADELNQRKFKTARGGEWTSRAVIRVLGKLPGHRPNTQASRKT